MPDLDDVVLEISDILSTVDGPLEESLRIQFAVARVVEYLHAAIEQQKRVDKWLYEPARRSSPTRFPIDQGLALCEAHFLFICWDTIGKTIDHVRDNAYGLVTPRQVWRTHHGVFQRYRQARDHLEHLTERYPGRSRSDWQGDRNHISGSVPGIRRTRQMIFQGQEWDVTEANVALLVEIVTTFVLGVAAELQDRLAEYRRGESATRRP